MTVLIDRLHMVLGPLAVTYSERPQRGSLRRDDCMRHARFFEAMADLALPVEMKRGDLYGDHSRMVAADISTPDSPT